MSFPQAHKVNAHQWGILNASNRGAALWAQADPRLSLA